MSTARTSLVPQLLDVVGRRAPACRPCQWLAIALEARRLDVRAVLEPLACDNPYPAGHFHALHFDDLVMAALEADLPLARIVGLGAQVTDQLAAAAARAAATLRASGRRPPPELWRLAWSAA